MRKKKMGSGFAKELRARYPGAYNAYMAEDELRMGAIIPYEAPDGRLIFNLIGQQNYGYDGSRYVSYDAIATGMENLEDIAEDIGMSVLAMPAIGSGLAGGSWKIISSIIECHSSNFQPVVYLLDGVIPTS